MTKLIPIFFFIFLFFFPSMAQEVVNNVLPQDSCLKTGVLDNGMKYYIYPNNSSTGLANFYIIHDVGAIQENPSQYGMAHFLEHMAFNGTTNFEGNSMIKYLETKGLKMGVDINAKTGFDDTQYRICNVSTYDKGLIDTTLMAIADWSGGISLKSDAIDKEKAVVIEEIRMSKNTQHNNMMSEVNLIWQGSAYEGRTIAGEIEDIENLNPSSLRDFYKTWYRPDMQAIIVVGDVDVKEIEDKIKKSMGAIPPSEHKQAKTPSTIANYPSNYAKALIDESLPYSKISINMLVKSIDKSMNSTTAVYALGFVNDVVALIMKKRFADISSYMISPFRDVKFTRQRLTPYNDIISCDLMVDKEELRSALSLVAKELNKMHKFGITQSEMFEAMDMLTMHFNIDHHNLNIRSNNDIAEVLISNFLRNTPILDPNYQQELDKEMQADISPSFLDDCIEVFYPLTNCCIIVSTPDEKRYIESEKNILKYYNNGLNEFLEMPANPIRINLNRPLVSSSLKPISIACDTTDAMGNILWKLDNGARVVVAPMPQVKDKVYMLASRKGGLSSLTKEDLGSACVLKEMLNIPLFNNFTPNEYINVTRKDQTELLISLSLDKQLYIGECFSKELKTLLQKLNLNVNHKSMDNKYAFGVVSKGMSDAVKKNELRSDYNFDHQMNKDNPYSQALTTPSSESINSARFAKVKDLHSTLFDGVKDMTFIFAGDINIEELKSYVELYIATLPAGSYSCPQQEYSLTDLRKGKETIYSEELYSKARYGLILQSASSYDHTLKDIILLKLTNNLLKMQLNEVIREKQGAAYSIASEIKYDKQGKLRLLSIKLDTNESALDSVSLNTLAILKDLASGADISHEFASSKEALIKDYLNNKKSVASIINWINSYYSDNTNYMNDYLNTLESITEQDISILIKDMLSSGSIYELTQESKPKK